MPASCPHRRNRSLDRHRACCGGGQRHLVPKRTPVRRLAWPRATPPVQWRANTPPRHLQTRRSIHSDPSHPRCTISPWACRAPWMRRTRGADGCVGCARAGPTTSPLWLSQTKMPGLLGLCCAMARPMIRGEASLQPSRRQTHPSQGGFPPHLQRYAEEWISGCTAAF